MKQTSKEFTAEELCRVIESCAKAQVTYLKLGDVVLKFAAAITPQTQTMPIIFQPTSDQSGQTEPDKKDEEPDLTDLMINNPAEYERYMMGDVGDGDRSTGQEKA